MQRISKLSLLLLLFAGLFFVGCKEKVEPDPEGCNYLGTVEDHADLEGGACGVNGLMIKLDDGSMLDVKNIPSGVQMAAGDRVSIDYEISENQATACQFGTPVNIICFNGTEVQPSLSQVKMGNWFGMCTGHCIFEMSISEDSLGFDRLSWPTSGVPDQHCDLTVPTADWDFLISSYSQTFFTALPDTSGCPDCLDQGGEWVEVTYNGNTYRKVFEYQQSMPSLDPFLPRLRQVFEDAKSQCN